MRETIEKLLPGEIEARSFEIIARELGERTFPPEQEAVIKRVIHTTADFDYADNLVFSDGAVEAAHAALKRGRVSSPTPTWPGRASTRPRWESWAARCSASWPTRTWRPGEGPGRDAGGGQRGQGGRAFRRAYFRGGKCAHGLIRLHERIREGALKPSLVIGVPVGFVNVIPAKELIMELEDVPALWRAGERAGATWPRPL